jgi:hypothetical protein
MAAVTGHLINDNPIVPDHLNRQRLCRFPFVVSLRPVGRQDAIRLRVTIEGSDLDIGLIIDFEEGMRP